MVDEIHPVVDLMLARMKSNPEEFAERYGGRWSDILTHITDCGSDAEVEAIREGTRSIILDKAHAQAMDELLNGDERRAKADRDLMTANRTANRTTQAVARTTAYANLRQYQNAAGTYATGAPLSLQNTVTSAVTSVNSIQLGNEQLDESTLTKIKKALGI
jgi:hypothetical protein